MIAAGAAAGLAAAFNAPLAGLVFAVEELQRDFASGVFTAAFMSAVSADLVEMTANYSLMLALLTACLAAYFTAEIVGSPPIYESLLQRLMMGGADKTPLRETVLVETPILPGAPFAGKP